MIHFCSWTLSQKLVNSPSRHTLETVSLLRSISNPSEEGGERKIVDFFETPLKRNRLLRGSKGNLSSGPTVFSERSSMATGGEMRTTNHASSIEDQTPNEEKEADVVNDLAQDSGELCQPAVFQSTFPKRT